MTRCDPLGLTLSEPWGVLVGWEFAPKCETGMHMRARVHVYACGLFTMLTALTVQLFDYDVFGFPFRVLPLWQDMYQRSVLKCRFSFPGAALRESERE